MGCSRVKTRRIQRPNRTERWSIYSKHMVRVQTPPVLGRGLLCHLKERVSSSPSAFLSWASPWIVSSARSSKVVFSSCGAENRPVGWCPLLYSCKRYKLRQIILKVPNSCDKAPTKQGILEPPLTDASLKPYWSCLWKPVNFTFSVFGTSSSAKPWLGCRVY